MKPKCQARQEFQLSGATPGDGANYPKGYLLQLQYLKEDTTLLGLFWVVMILP